MTTWLQSRKMSAWLLATLGIELQVQFVEEPYLVRTHGAAYREYAAA